MSILFGSATTTNRTDATINSTTEILTSNIENCASYVDMDQDFTISNSSNINVSDVDMTQVVTLDQSCFMDVTTTNDITNTASISASQDAESTAKSFGMSTSDATAEYIISMELLSIIDEPP